MAYLAHNLFEGYDYLVKEFASPITKNWFMVDNPLYLIIVLSGYLYFCLSLGPWYMKNREPYDLQNVMKIYNIFQILINLYFFYEGTYYIFFSNVFNFYCKYLDEPSSPVALRIAEVVWLYYMVKIIDLLDTFFFVLRKSDRQITKLHLHHHTMMAISSWITALVFPGGQGVIIGYINAFVHVVMYTYYLVSGLGHEYKKYLWWKKYLTILQLIQFVIVAVHSTNSLFYSCSFPVFLKVLIIVYSLSFINMFGQFYYYSYVKNKNEKTENCSTNDIKKTESKVNEKTL